jgi:hypothetical protein
MLGEVTAPTGSPETFVCVAIDASGGNAGRLSAKNEHGVLTGVTLAVADPAIADQAAVLGLGPQSRSGRRQDHQRHDEGCYALHESNLPVRSNGSQQSGLLDRGSLSSVCRELAAR